MYTVTIDKRGITMKLHNILEEEVIDRIRNIYNDAEKNKTPWLTCSCEQCQLDTAAYVLNRMPPRYVVSERGIAHAEAQSESQLDADVDQCIIEGMKQVASVTRAFHGKTSSKGASKKASGVSYNFPIFSGALFDGNSFEPLQNATITLKYENEACEMHNVSWINPYTLHSKNNGRYAFWIKPLSCDESNEEKVFNFLIEIQSNGYEDTMFSFSVTAKCSAKIKQTPDTTQKITIQDLYLFPSEK